MATLTAGAAAPVLARIQSASPPARLRRPGRTVRPTPRHRARRCRLGGSPNPNQPPQNMSACPWHSFRDLLPTDRHDALRSLYWRSRRTLPTGRPSWPETEAQVPPGAHSTGGAWLLPAPWLAPSVMDGNSQWQEASVHCTRPLAPPPRYALRWSQWTVRSKTAKPPKEVQGGMDGPRLPTIRPTNRRTASDMR